MESEQLFPVLRIADTLLADEQEWRATLKTYANVVSSVRKSIDAQLRAESRPIEKAAQGEYLEAVRGALGLDLAKDSTPLLGKELVALLGKSKLGGEAQAYAAARTRRQGLERYVHALENAGTNAERLGTWLATYGDLLQRAGNPIDASEAIPPYSSPLTASAGDFKRAAAALKSFSRTEARRLNEHILGPLIDGFHSKPLRDKAWAEISRPYGEEDPLSGPVPEPIRGISLATITDKAGWALDRSLFKPKPREDCHRAAALNNLYAPLADYFESLDEVGRAYRMIAAAAPEREARQSP